MPMPAEPRAGPQAATQAQHPDVSGVRALADLCARAGVSDLEASDGSWSIRLRFDPDAAGASAIQLAAISTPEEAEPTLVRSGWVGIFHRAADAESAPSLREGERVEAEGVIGVIEAMQLQHQQRSETAGIAARFLVEDGTPVEYGQPLLELG